MGGRSRHCLFLLLRRLNRLLGLTFFWNSIYLQLWYDLFSLLIGLPCFLSLFLSVNEREWEAIYGRMRYHDDRIQKYYYYPVGIFVHLPPKFFLVSSWIVFSTSIISVIAVQIYSLLRLFYIKSRRNTYQLGSLSIAPSTPQIPKATNAFFPVR